MTEANLQRKITLALRNRGAWVVKYHGGPHASIGIPDLLVCYKGRFLGMEVKRPEKKDNVTKLQLKQLHKIQEAGGKAIVVTSVKEAIQVLKDLEDE